MDHSAYMPTFPGQMAQHGAPPPNSSSQQCSARPSSDGLRFNPSESSSMDQAPTMPAQMHEGMHGTVPHPSFASMPHIFGSHVPSRGHIVAPQAMQDPGFPVAHPNQAPRPPIYPSYAPFAASGAPMIFVPQAFGAPGQNNIGPVYTTAQSVLNGPLIQNNYGSFALCGVNVQEHIRPSMHAAPANSVPAAHNAPMPQTEQFQSVPSTSHRPAHHRYNENGEQLDCYGLTRGQAAARTKELKKLARKPTQCSYCEQIGHNKTRCQILYPEKSKLSEKSRFKDSKQSTEGRKTQNQKGDVIASHHWPCESAIVRPTQQQHESQFPVTQAPIGDIAQPNVEALAHQQHTTPPSSAPAPSRPSVAAGQTRQQVQDSDSELFDYDRWAPMRAQLEGPLVMFEGVEGGPVVVPPWNPPRR